MIKFFTPYKRLWFFLMYVNGICIQLFQNLYSQCQENENIQCKTNVVVIKTELREVVAEVKANSRQNGIHRIHRCEDQTCCLILQQRETYRLWNVAQTRSGLMEVDMKIRLCCLADVIKMDPQWIKFAVKLLCNAECSNTKEYWFLWEAMQKFYQSRQAKTFDTTEISKIDYANNCLLETRPLKRHFRYMIYLYKSGDKWIFEHQK